MPVRRTTARRMAAGIAGWSGVAVTHGIAKPLDLVFWTFTRRRPHGHVGAVWRIRGRKGTVTHASYKRGVVVDPWTGTLRRNVSKIIRLTTGDSK
jgi:hypothetical protein